MHSYIYSYVYKVLSLKLTTPRESARTSALRFRDDAIKGYASLITNSLYGRLAKLAVTVQGRKTNHQYNCDILTIARCNGFSFQNSFQKGFATKSVT